MSKSEEQTRAEQRKREEQTRAEQRKSEKNVLYTFWAVLGTGIAGLLIFSVSQAASLAEMWKAFALGLLVAGSASLIGAVVGFLFGLPRSSTEGSPAQVAPAPPAQTAPDNNPTNAQTATPRTEVNRRFGYVNNNLLEISDWLTKIIVGAGLVGLKDLVRWIGELGKAIGTGAGLGGGELAAVFGGSVITYFFGWGFLFVYIQTRTIISFIFASMDRSLQDLGTTIRDAVATQVGTLSEAVANVMPRMENAVSENTILQLLYNSEPSAAGAVAERAREFLGRPGNDSNARVWLYLACAYGQQHAAATDPAVKQELANKSYDALKRAIDLDPSMRNLARGLMYTDDPHSLPGDDDLVTLRGDPRFRELVGPPPG